MIYQRHQTEEQKDEKGDKDEKDEKDLVHLVCQLLAFFLDNSPYCCNQFCLYHALVANSKSDFPVFIVFFSIKEFYLEPEPQIYSASHL